MELMTALSRAKRGFRDDLRLHAVAVASLVIAFLCLGAALLSVTNLARIAERWGQSQHVSIYLKDTAKESDVAQLRLVLESLPEIVRVEHVSAAQARKQFATQSALGSELEGLPADAFPATLELSLRDGASQDRIAKVVERIRHFPAVEDVETYKQWFEQLGTLLSAGRSAALMLAMLVVVCVLAVIGNTIRLAVANRRREIEVLKLCGATDAYVRSPFVLEGVIQAVAAASLALVLLVIMYFSLRGYVEGTFAALTGVHTTFLDPLTALAIVVGGGLVGALGSTLSLRRYLAV
jgi:cell division transport system permease protein